MDSAHISLVLGTLKTSLYVMTVTLAILSAGWVCCNGYFYSVQQSINWTTVMLTVLLLEPILLEPLVYLLLAFLSANVWRRSMFISQSTERFRDVIRESHKRETMAKMMMTADHLTGFIHKQALEDSPALYYLHHTIHRALKNVLGVPKVVFKKAVYWLLLYTVCTVLLVRLQTDAFSSYQQKANVQRVLGYHDTEESKMISLYVLINGRKTEVGYYQLCVALTDRSIEARYYHLFVSL
ncbi:hypothetical protein RRG08_040589 [Elysia crispata]|uniref:Uncharacterized protein n=1 Tax=Elysia crispata TaxID=231223 RepID=A0AAE0YJT5_9GAST|nr:hypothetical protein RRG08_040589 [Elysia crispata]